MYHVRDEFQLKFGKAREARESAKKFAEYLRSNGFGEPRFYTDFTGPSYRIIFENDFDSLAEYEKNMSAVMGTDEWRSIYQEFCSNVETSNREILRRMEV